MTHVRNIDDLIHGIPEAQPINPAKSPVYAENKPEESEKVAPKEPESVEIEPIKPELLHKNDENPSETSKNTENKAVNVENPTDEYGNPIAKPKMYSEEEVQRMIRDRLSRGRFKNEVQEPVIQPTPQQVQQAQSLGFEHDQDSDVAWEAQLEQFVERTFNKLSAKQVEQQKKQVEQQQRLVEEHAQVEFEDKFQNGMSRYPDFVQTLSDKPVTDAMMMGVRGIENPAAFLYAAAKKFPDELARISKIPDQYQQVAEMGRLHERLSKPRAVTGAPRVMSHDRSDVNDKSAPKYSIDHLIAEDAKTRRR